MIYSCNKSSLLFFNALPERVRLAMIENMEEIWKAILDTCPHAVITSAFRKPSYSRSLNGQPDSQHGYGNAIDVALEGVDAGALRASGCFRLVLEEEDHVHITGF